MFRLCLNCANLLPPDATACPRCGQGTQTIDSETKLEPMAEHDLVCAARFHYVPKGSDACRCGLFTRRQEESGGD